MSESAPVPPAPTRRALLRGLGSGGAVVICAVAILLLGVANPPADDGISTDRLGPDTGETVAGYLDRARESLTGPGDGDRWALVSFTGYRPATGLRELLGGIRVGQVLYRVPLPRVVTPLSAVQVPDSEPALTRSGRDAADQLADRRRHTAGGTRPARILDVSVARLRSGCACSPAVVVHAPLPRLRDLADRPGIRAVQALPRDAGAERFAVVPLLPDTTDPIGLPPDDGPVPPR